MNIARQTTTRAIQRRRSAAARSAETVSDPEIIMIS
jgi:hypothetical protein